MNPLLTDSRRQALRSASHWYAVLSGERVSPQQEARWQQWYEQDQDNQWAWQQVENLRNQLGGVPGDVASRALHDTGLRLSGTFPLKNTDAILNVIAQTLPVKIQSITRYWINISPL
ncbi:DUF4880 domain-containing protein [Escherichia coli]|nr:DUF4880 domain-containing protein [Escherichia coli]